jgi:hypothetical protein
MLGAASSEEVGNGAARTVLLAHRYGRRHRSDGVGDVTLMTFSGLASTSRLTIGAPPPTGTSRSGRRRTPARDAHGGIDKFLICS